MTALITACIALAIVFGGALVGLHLQARLPDHHLSGDSRDIVKLSAGVIATLAALVLGLLVSSAKGTLDSMDREVMQTAVKAMVLDRLLADYGPQTKAARQQLHEALRYAIDLIDNADSAVAVARNSTGLPHGIDRVQASLRGLVPQNDDQRWLQAQALTVSSDMADDGWLIIEESESSLPLPFIVALVLWLAAIFASFGLFAPRNATVMTVMFVCSLSVAASIFLIIEMDRPVGGLIRVSTKPLVDALARVGQ